MKLKMVCVRCLEERVKHLSPGAFEPPLQAEFFEIPFRDEPFYEFVCPNGHETAVFTTHLLFEVLLEIAVQAIEDGYHREAVTSAYGAIERLHESYVRASWLERSTDEDAIDQAWKQVARQSERQLGMFVYAYTLANGAPPPEFKQTRFRNDVVHKGIIPSRDQAVDFVQAAADYMGPIKDNAVERSPEGWQKLSAQTRERAWKAAGKPVSVPTFGDGAVLDELSEGRTVREVLKRRAYFAATPYEDRDPEVLASFKS